MFLVSCFAFSVQHSAMCPEHCALSLLDPVFPEEPGKEVSRAENCNHGNKSGNGKNCHARESGTTCTTTSKLGSIDEKDTPQESEDQPPGIRNIWRFFNFKLKSFRDCS